MVESLAFLVAAGVWVEVSTPVIPGFNADRDSLRRIAEHVCRNGRHIPWHLLRFTPEFRFSQLRPTLPEELAEAAAIGREAGLDYVYVERALGQTGRDTLCPRCGSEVVARQIWAVGTVSLSNGRFARCDYPIPGRW